MFIATDQQTSKPRRGGMLMAACCQYEKLRKSSIVTTMSPLWGLVLCRAETTNMALLRSWVCRREEEGPRE